MHTLTTPASISAAVTTFTAPSGATLAASTTYYVVISTTGSGISLGRTNAAAEDTGGVSGWSIADSRRFLGGSGWNTTTNPIRMRVNGDAATSTNSPATGAPTITGTAQVGESLTADISNIGDPDGIADADFEYQWITNDGTTDSDISGATESTYWPPAGDVGNTIKVRVTFDDDLNNEESLTSAATGAVVGAAVTVVPSDWGLIPSGLGPGDQFRLIFLSSETRFAGATDIATYNTWAQGLAANGHTDIQDYSSTFRVVGSTAAVDARDNTGTTYTSDDKGVPIYWLNGNKAADDYEDFYDETWDEEASMRDESGDTVTAPSSVWTGSDHDGTEFLAGRFQSSRALGSSEVETARPNSNTSNEGPISGSTSFSSITPLNLYSLSGVFQVFLPEIPEIPADSSLVPSGLGQGDQFRLIFLSSETRTAVPTDIAIYNAWVQGLAANGHADIQDHSSTFRVVGSTAAVDARDNTSTTYTSSDKGVAIHWLNGDKAADDYEDFYDETWDEEASMRDESGTTVTAPTSVWTGSKHDGTKIGWPLGNAGLVTIGRPNSTISTDGPLSSSVSNSSPLDKHLYALSGVFQVGAIEVPADWSLVPSGLQEGDQFRLLFISSTHRNASPSNIATYNTWIQDLAANGHTDIQDYSSSFRAVGSTEDMDARDNTGTTYTSSDKGVAIYWLGGNKVADDYEDFYDEDWDEEAAMKNESGTAETGVSAWTGSDHDGTEMLQGTPETSRALGNSNNAWVRFGKTDSASHGPLSGATAARGGNKRIYGLSSVFEVVAGNNPATGAPTITGTPQVGGVLTANLSNVTDPDGLVNVSYSYQWIADDGTTETDIDHATGETYRPITADEDKTVKVRVSFTDDEGNPESLTSAATGAVSPWDKGELIWSALLTVGEYDTGGPILFGFSTGLAGSLEPPTFTFASTDITITTLAYNTPGSGLQLNAAIADRQALGSGAFGLYLDEAHWLFTNPADRPDIPIRLPLRSLSWTDGQEVEVRLTVNRAPTAGPTIAGDVQVGGTLTADPSAIVDPDGIATGATYTYQWVRVDGMNETNISGATASSYTLVADDGGKTIKVKVSYTDEANFVDTATSNATTKVATAPAPPTGVDITTEGNGELTVGWTAPTENGGSDITGYKVQWKSGTQSFGSSRQHTTADGTATSYTIPSLTNGTLYTVRVLAVNSVGDSAASNTDTGTPSTTPSAPTNVQASGNAELTVTWDAPDDGGSAITGYTVQWKSGSESYSTTRQATVTTTTHTIPSLTNDTTYTLRVKATNANGDSDWTETTGTPASGPSVGTVTSGMITQTSAVITVTIANPDTNTQTVNLQYKRNADTNWTSGGARSTVSAAVTFTLSSLTGNTDYDVRASLDSAFDSGVVTAAFKTSPVKPAPPTGVDITTEGNGELTVGWTAPTENGGSDITGYKVQWKSGTQSFGTARSTLTADGAATSYTIPSLTNGTEYTVRVLAVNSVGDSAASNTDTGTPSTTPSAPTNVLASGNAELTVTWDAPDDGGSAITGYTVQWKSGTQSYNTTRQATVTTTTHTIGSLTNDTTYTLRVKATNANGDSGWTEITATPVSGPGVASVTVDQASITQTLADVTVTMANPQNEVQVVFLRYRVAGDAWPSARKPDPVGQRDCRHLHPDRADREHGLRRGGVAGQHLRLGSQDRHLHDLAHEAG